MTREELSANIRRAFTKDGNWDRTEVGAFEPDVWKTWIEFRLCGQDPYVPYGRDEYPEIADQLFVSLAREASGLDIDLSKCKVGAAEFLGTLDAASEEPIFLKQAMTIVGHLRAREAPALETLRRWISRKSLMKREGLGIDLHRTALHTLAALQERGNLEDAAIWKKWFEWKDGPPQDRYAFTSAAFCGIVFSNEAVPASALRRLLEIHRKQSNASRPHSVTTALLSLWVDREREEDLVREELWNAISSTSHPEENWETIQRVGDRMRHDVPSYGEMLLIDGSQNSASSKMTAPQIRFVLQSNAFGPTWSTKTWLPMDEMVRKERSQIAVSAKRARDKSHYVFHRQGSDPLWKPSTWKKVA